MGVFAVAVLGLNVIMGYTGQVSLGQIFFLGMGAYVTAYGVNADWNIVVVFLAAVILTGISGVIVAQDRKSTRLNSSHVAISYAVFCLKKKKKNNIEY